MPLNKIMLVALSSLVLSACGGGSGGSSEKKESLPESNLTYYSTYSSEHGQCSHVASDNSEAATEWLGAGGTIGKCPTNDAIAYCTNIHADPRLDFHIYYYRNSQLDQSILAQSCQHLGGTFMEYVATPDETENNESQRPDNLQPLHEIADATEFQNFADVSYLSNGIVWDLTREQLVEINGAESFPIYDTYLDFDEKKLKSILWQDNPQDELGTPVSIFDYSSGQIKQLSNGIWKSSDVCVDVYWYGSGNALVSTKSTPSEPCWTGEIFLLGSDSSSESSPISVSFGREWYENRLTASIKNQNGKLEGVLTNIYAENPTLNLYDNGAFTPYSLNFNSTSNAETKTLGVVNGSFLFLRNSKIYKLSREQIKFNQSAIDISSNFEDLHLLAGSNQFHPIRVGEDIIYSLDLFNEGAYFKDIYTLQLDGTFIKRARVQYHSQLSIYKTGEYYVTASIGNSESIPVHFQYFNMNWEPSSEYDFYRHVGSTSSCIIQLEDSIALYNGNTVSILKETSVSEEVSNSYLIQLTSAVREETISNRKNKVLSVNTNTGVVSHLGMDGMWSEIGSISIDGNPAYGNCAKGWGVYLGDKFVVSPNGTSGQSGHGVIFGNLSGEINTLPQYSM